MKLRLAQEQANSRINKLKIQNQWRKIMRPEKAETLKKEIEILSQNHERDVDRKDAIIQMLDRDLEEAEDQFQMSLRSHLQNMDRLIDLQDTRLLALEQEFEKDLLTLEQDFGTERKAIIKQHAAEVEELEYIMDAVSNKERELELEATQEHEQIREEIKNKNLEEINMLRIQLDSQIEDLEQKFENAHLNYLQTTDTRTADFKYYTKRDQEVSKDIEVKIRSIERLQSSLNQCRQRYSTAVKECSARNALLTDEKNKLQGRFQQNRMNKFREGQAKKMAELSRKTSEGRAVLQRNIELAESILKSAELARKFETEREKVAPFDMGANAYDMESEIILAQKKQKEEQKAAFGETGGKGGVSDGTTPLPFQSAALHPSTGSVVPKWEQLQKYLKKYNKVLFEKLAIERGNQRLRDENARLQETLQKFMNGISVNDSVMDDPENPLLVVNGRVRLERPMPVARQDITVMDGNHLVATSRINTTAL